MARISKQRACIACTNAKRRCDRTLPGCMRCLDKDMDCMYPPINRRHGRQEQRQTRGGLSWPTTSAAATASSLPAATAAAAPSSRTTSTRLISSPGSPGLAAGSWFLTPATWSITPHDRPLNSFPVSVFTNFIRGLQDWLARFLRYGHNPFVHRGLYAEAPFPRCIQDAYASIAIARTITPQNENHIYDILSTYVSDLVDSQSQPALDFFFSAPLLSTREHLARTQALLIYLILTLFSPSIPGRAKAEALIPTLHLWSQQLWDSALLDANISSLPPSSSSHPSTDVAANAETGMMARIYRAFALSESTRRTWLLVKYMIGTYQVLKDGSTSCEGGIFFTARAELWDAPSAARWGSILKSTDPLFIHSLHADAVIHNRVPAVEVDEFVRHLLTAQLGVEKVESWGIETGNMISVLF
ncbi:hypothetical protein BGZ61DRAFT_439908 [Ilyonectria robusta]|uniref:uncharacterized protein n=1 Tax=Ilyonectria robusta TaxID=1079257 RepID=UPI001E8EA7B2|nr:uncharacterized protein BGZ61DRAFT_439908 [Ilyonectria robusta]KAH8738305.1 hypothetical protein BGZ61DRAFT_439908 [Ilyonectria robusta]